MEVLCFKIKGKLAHFRRYYANNTALSFSIPPRTSLMGLVAAVMGWKRDEYYEKLSSENLHFGIRVLSPLKKSFHRLNFLSIKSTGDIAKSFNSDFRGDGGRIQTPFEIVSGLNIVKDEVTYQIFLNPLEKGKPLFEEIKSHFINGKPIFNLSLGTANFGASIYDIELIESSQVKEQMLNDFIDMHSAVPSKMVETLQFEKEKSNQYNFVEEDLLPGDFFSDNNREVKKMNRLLFSTTNLPIRVKLKEGYYQITTKDGSLNIQFMDS
jgi:CRISPR-associated protein Cas5h